MTPSSYNEGYQALLDENATGDLFFNPYPEGYEDHDWWDKGYQDAKD